MAPKVHPMAVIARHFASALVATICLGSTLLLATVRAQAVDSRIEAACSADYFALCGQHDPDGTNVRRCMRTNGAKLSRPCVDALVAAGEVTQTTSRRSPRSR